MSAESRKVCDAFLKFQNVMINQISNNYSIDRRYLILEPEIEPVKKDPFWTQQGKRTKGKRGSVLMSNAYDVNGNMITGAIPRRFVDSIPQKRIDHIRAHTPHVRDERKIGRNEPCPCRSGLKFKKCHGG